MSNRTRLFVMLVVLVGGMGLMGCATVQAPPELITALESGNIGLVESILEENPKLVNSAGNFPNLYNDASTPLYYAVMANNKDMVKLLLEKGANVNAKVKDDHFGETSFFAALKSGRVEVLPLLLEGGANLNARNSFGETPLYSVMSRRYSFSGEATKSPNAKDMAMILIDNGANVKVSEGGETLLHHAADSGWYDLAELLIEKGVNVNAKAGSKRSFPGYTALHYAVQFNYMAINKEKYPLAELLIANGADINAKDKKGKTPLTIVIKSKRKEIIDLLRKHGAIK